MMNFPLQLNYYFITQIYVKANSESECESDRILNIEDFDIKFHIFENDENSPFQCNMSVTSKQGLPYDFDIEIVGFFSFVTEIEDSKKPLFLINAPSTLYSIARDQIALITAQGPLTKIILPLIDARGFQIKEPEESKPKRQATHKKSAIKKATSKKSTQTKTTRKKS